MTGTDSAPAPLIAAKQLIGGDVQQQSLHGRLSSGKGVTLTVRQLSA